MESALLMCPDFWNDSAPVAAGAFPGVVPELPELGGHVLFETSGSMGAPKWVALSKGALLRSAAAVNCHLQVDAGSCWGLALPLHHVGGFGVAARAYQAGCRLEEFAHRWNPGDFADWLEEKQVTHVSLVPTQVHDLVEAELRSPSRLRASVVGGGRLEAALGRAARDLGWPVLASYGMTESASQIATQDPGAIQEIYQPFPMPVLPIWKTSVSDDGRLRIAGAALFSGTLTHENGSWRFIRRMSEWYQTQDRVVLDHGLLTPMGRADAVVKVLGELVDPEAIEREILDLSEGLLAPGSFMVAVLSDERAGSALVPVFDAAVDPSLIRGILDSYAGCAPGFRRLREAEILNDFPRSVLGKPLRSEITRILCERRAD